MSQPPPDRGTTRFPASHPAPGLHHGTGQLYPDFRFFERRSRRMSVSTSLGLLWGLKVYNRQAWERFFLNYDHVIREWAAHWCRRHGLPANDAAEVAEEVSAGI